MSRSYLSGRTHHSSIILRYSFDVRLPTDTAKCRPRITILSGLPLGQSSCRRGNDIFAALVDLSSDGLASGRHLLSWGRLNTVRRKGADR
jgi:hypothetical protein